MVRYAPLLLACLSVVIGEIKQAHGYMTRGDTKLAEDGGENKQLKPVHIDGAAAALRMGINEFGLESYSEQVEEAELLYDDIGQGDRFEFLICLERKVDVSQACDETENLDQIMLAVLRAGFMDLDVLFAGIKQVGEGEGESRELRRRGKYKYGGYGCRRCRKTRRKLNQDETTGGYDEYDDSISDDAIAAKMIGALRIAIIDTLAINPDSCLFSLVNELLRVDIEFGK